MRHALPLLAWVTLAVLTGAFTGTLGWWWWRSKRGTFNKAALDQWGKEP